MPPSEPPTLEARSVYNEIIQLAKDGLDWDKIPDRVVDDADLVKNTTQCVVAKALGAVENYRSARRKPAALAVGGNQKQTTEMLHNSTAAKQF